MQIINLTPHDVTLVNDDNTTTYPKSGNVCRVSQTSTPIEGASLPLVKETFGDVEGLPEQVADTFLIVSRIVMAAAPDRTDLIAPTDFVRNDKGQIVGCKSFATNKSGVDDMKALRDVVRDLDRDMRCGDYVDAYMQEKCIKIGELLGIDLQAEWEVK